MTEFYGENCLVVIPARSGSKRLLSKNIKILGSKPLLAWSIEVAQSVVRAQNIVVSTDSEEYANISRDYGAIVPNLRSPENSADNSSTADAIHECICQYESSSENCVGWVVLLQPTSPFRRRSTIEEALTLFKQYKGDTIVSVTSQKNPLNWMLEVDEDRVLSDAKLVSSPQQSLVQPNGNIYVFSRDVLDKTGDIYSENPRALIINDPIESLDIDTMEDWQIAERYCSLFS